MPRKKTPAPFDPEENTDPALIEKAAADLDTRSAMQPEFDETMELGQLVGRLQTAEFYETISGEVRTQTYKLVMKSKAWKNIVNPKTGNHFQNVDEFCEIALGRTRRRMNQLTANREVLGDAYKQAEELGLRQKDYNAIKALPAPDQALIRQATEEAQDKAEVIELLEEIVVRHAEEKEAWGQETKGAEADLEASRIRVTELKAEKSELEDEVHKLRHIPIDERIEELSKRLEQITTAGVTKVLELEQLTKQIAETPDLPQHMRDACAQSCNRIYSALDELRDGYGLIDLSSQPGEDDWIEAAKATCAKETVN